MKLCFGQQRYTYADGKTTSVQVARRLEKKYKLKQVFFGMNKKQIQSLYVQALQDSVNDAVHGVYRATDVNNLFGKANNETTQMFRDALNQQSFDGVVDGVATKRALMGISSRFKYGYVTKKNKDGTFRKVKVKLDNGKTKTLKVYARPSFIDTQLYRNSSRTWIKE